MPIQIRSKQGHKERGGTTTNRLGQKVRNAIAKTGAKLRFGSVPYGIAMSALGRMEDMHSGIPPHTKSYADLKHKRKSHNKKDDWVAGRQRHTGGATTRLGGNW